MKNMIRIHHFQITKYSLMLSTTVLLHVNIWIYSISMLASFKVITIHHHRNLVEKLYSEENRAI